MWKIESFQLPNNKSNYITVIGTDLTALRTSEKKLHDLFSSIQLGILTIDKNGFIEPTFSAYSEVLLGSNISNNYIQDILFANSFSEGEKINEKVQNEILKCIDGPVKNFYILRDFFPKEILFYPKHQKEKFLSVSYQPITKGKILEKILLIIEDRTELAKEKLEGKQAKSLHEKEVTRYLQVKNCSFDILSMVFIDLKRLILSAKDEIASQKSKEFFNLMHAIKGTARIAGFRIIADFVHNFESEFEDKKNRSDIWTDLESKYNILLDEWDEFETIISSILAKSANNIANQNPNNTSHKENILIKKLLSKFNSTVNHSDLQHISEIIKWSLQSFNFLSLKKLEPLIQKNSEETSKSLNKNVNLIFIWDEFYTTQEIRESLSEILLHLITNAIVHGIETKEIRKAHGKSLEGNIRIHARESEGNLILNIDDDGGGIQVESLKKAAVMKKILTPEESLQIPRKKAMDLIFEEGISTKKTMSHLAGRGVGLDAIKQLIKKNHGSIMVDDNIPFGTRFEFMIANPKDFAIFRNQEPGELFAKRLDQYIVDLGQSKSLPVKPLPENAYSFIKEYQFYGDILRLPLAIAVHILLFATEGSIDIHLKESQRGTVTLLITRKKIEDFCVFDEELSLAKIAATHYLAEHRGECAINGSQMSISFGEFSRS